MQQRIRFGRHVEVSASLTHLRATFEDSGNPLPGRPEQSWTLRATGRPGRFEFWVQARHAGAFALHRFGRREEEPHLYLDAGAAARAFDWLYVTVEGRNLTNVRNAVDQYQFPLPGLAVYAGATVRL